jgi:hypothetical protein
MCGNQDELVVYALAWSPLFVWLAFGMWWECREGRKN